MPLVLFAAKGFGDRKSKPRLRVTVIVENNFHDGKNPASLATVLEVQDQVTRKLFASFAR